MILPVASGHEADGSFTKQSYVCPEYGVRFVGNDGWLETIKGLPQQAEHDGGLHKWGQGVQASSGHSSGWCLCSGDAWRGVDGGGDCSDEAEDNGDD